MYGDKYNHYFDKILRSKIVFKVNLFASFHSELTVFEP